MNVFEDAGYFCVDNLPAEMIRSLAQLFPHDGSKVERAASSATRAAASTCSRRSSRCSTTSTPSGAVHARRLPRGRRGRRSDPLQGDAPAPPARAATATSPTASTREQRAAGADPRPRRHRHRHDRADRAARCAARSPTSCSSPASRASSRSPSCRFGHKHGPPRDADLVFDVRFLPNPHYEPELRPLTGFDRRIVDYVGRDGRLERVLRPRACRCSSTCCPQYVAEGKAHLVVAVGLHRRAAPLGRHRRAPRRALPRRRAVLRRGPAPRRRPRGCAGL